MYEKKFRKLAERVVNYSIGLKQGEKVFINAIDRPNELVSALIKEVSNVGGFVYVENNITEIKKHVLRESLEEIQYICDLNNKILGKMDAYIEIRNSENINQYYNIPIENMIRYTKYYNRPALAAEEGKTIRRTVLRYPSNELAQMAGLNHESFLDYYFRITLIDYKKFYDYCNIIKDLVDKTERITIRAPGTDLELSVTEKPSAFGMGKGNIPDGELCTVPDKESVNGHITINIPSNYMGRTFRNIYLEFNKGKIVKASSNYTSDLNKILDSDPEARYLCEFSIGLHPFIDNPVIDTLIDEKMTGSIHVAPGYMRKNPSVIHWDIIQSHLPQYGGGEIWFDDKLIRKDGTFVIKELEPLNPEPFSKFIEDNCML